MRLSFISWYCFLKAEIKLPAHVLVLTYQYRVLKSKALVSITENLLKVKTKNGTIWILFPFNVFICFRMTPKLIKISYIIPRTSFCYTLICGTLCTSDLQPALPSNTLVNDFQPAKCCSQYPNIPSSSWESFTQMLSINPLLLRMMMARVIDPLQHN